MPASPDGPALERVLRALLVASRRVQPDRLPALVADALATVGATGVEIHLPDFSRRELRAVVGDEVQTIHGTLAGRAFITQAVIRHPDNRTVWVPLNDGEDRIGVMRVDSDLDDDALDLVASAVAGLLVSRRRLTDHFDAVRAARPLTVAARMQWSTLPPPSFATDEMAVACALEPAYSIGGDSFDYAANGDLLHFAIFDAMGHGAQAALTSFTAVTAYRQARLSGQTLEETYTAINDVVADLRPSGFATGVLAELHCRTGRMRWLNAGHPEPFLLRGHRVPGALHAEPALPFGMDDLSASGEQRRHHIAEMSLEPGDRVLLYTDGVVDAVSPEGERFGEDRVADDLARSAVGREAAEAVRRITLEVVDFAGGHLTDDATLLLVAFSPSV